MVHTVIPTTLSIKRFYAEYANLFIQLYRMQRDKKDGFKDKSSQDYFKMAMGEMYSRLRKVAKDYE